MICENCRIRPASVQVTQQRGGQRSAAYLCTQCARELGMIGGGGFGGANPFEMLQNLVQQQHQGPGNFFEALTEEAREAVMRAREVSAGTTPANAIGTDHLLAGIVTGDNVATEALRRAGADVDGMRANFSEHRGDPGEQVYTSLRAPSGRCSSHSRRPGRWARPRSGASICFSGCSARATATLTRYSPVMGPTMRRL